MTQEGYMQEAISLALKGSYNVHPNPKVGCILVKNNEIIGILGDYDVDGTTAVAMMYSFLKDTAIIDYYIPDRYKEGYGLSKEGIDFAAENAVDLVVSLDCGINYTDLFLITQDNHVTSNELATINIDISSLVGESVKFRFLGIWGTGDYYLDIDNINIFQCSSLDLVTIMTSESSVGEGDGTVSVMPNASLGPYTYLWDTGDNTATVTGISAGTYQVTVTDGFGCVDVAIIDLMVNRNQIDLMKILSKKTNSVI